MVAVLSGFGFVKENTDQTYKKVCMKKEVLSKLVLCCWESVDRDEAVLYRLTATDFSATALSSFGGQFVASVLAATSTRSAEQGIHVQFFQ